MSDIIVLKPSCTEAEVEAVAEVLRSCWWGMGPKCKEFERRMVEMTAYEHCVTVNSCTAALHLAVLAHDIGPGDEVIVPALTFVSTALAASYVGARPVFADIDERTLCIDWQDVANKITPRTKAIIPVDFAGHPASPTIAIPSDITIIQDAAHFSGGRVHYGDEACYSYHPVKNVATGDGGAILTNDAARAERMRALRWCGIDQSTWQRSGNRYSWDYSIQEIGYKFHWNDIQAAIGLVQMDRLPATNQRRREIAARYDAELNGLFVSLPPQHRQHTHHLYPIRVPAYARDRIIDHMAEHGIGVGVHYKPLTHYPMYSDQETPPVTEREWQRLISLPIHPDMTDGDQARVIDVFREFFRGGYS